MADPNKSCETRTHEPNLRELTADLDGVKELMIARLDSMEKLALERDKWYTERDKDRQASVDKALTAVKEQTKASFEASEKAIVKAEEAQKSYNQSHNDLSRKLDEQNKATMPRTETEARFTGQEEKIAGLREAKSNMDGRMVILGVAGAAIVSLVVSWVSLSMHAAPGAVPQQQPMIYVPAPPGSIFQSSPPK